MGAAVLRLANMGMIYGNGWAGKYHGNICATEILMRLRRRLTNNPMS